MIRKLICMFRGLHEEFLTVDKDTQRIVMRCVGCGWRSPGVQVGGREDDRG